MDVGAVDSVPGQWRRAFAYGVLAGLSLTLAVVVLLFVQLAPSATTGRGGMTARTLVFGVVGDFLSTHPGAVDGIRPGIRGAGFVPPPLYYAIGVLVLAGSGYGASPSTPTADLRNGVILGASIVVGYLPIVIGHLLVLWQFDPAFVSLDPLRALFVAGVVLPVFFGAIGGALSTLVTRHRRNG